MGISVELPASRNKKRAVGSLVKQPGASQSLEADHWQWGTIDYQATDEETIVYPTTRTTPPADALSDSPDSSKQLISPSITYSASSSSPDSSFETASPSFSSTSCADTFTGKSAHRKLRKSEVNSLTFGCRNGDVLRPSRWDSGRWSPASSLERSGNPAGGFCKCAAGLTADVAAVCCCPFSLLHLLAIAFIKLPRAVICKALARIKLKIKKRKRSTDYEEDRESVPASSYPPSRSRSCEAGDIQSWALDLGFGDQRLWRDYFDSPDNAGVWTSAELLRSSKS